MESGKSQTPYRIAQMLLETLPVLGRLISVRMRETGEEEATLMQVGVLMHIKDQPITTSDLAKRRKVSLQSTSVLVQNMVERGWLTRVPDPNDRRQSLLEVTVEGRIRAEATQEQVLRMMAEALAGFTSEEMDAAASFLPALHRVVNQQLMPEALLEE